MTLYRILVGSYTDHLTTLKFDSDARTLSVEARHQVPQNPSWVEKHPTHKLVFAGIEDDRGRVVVGRVDGGQWETLGEVETGGGAVAHICVRGNELVVANYGTSSVSFIPLNLSSSSNIFGKPTLIEFKGSGPNKERQERPHPHQVCGDLNDEFLIPDLGSDTTWRLTKSSDGWKVSGSIQYAPGDGPRHLAVRDGVLYSALELSTSLSAHTLTPIESSASPKHISTSSTLTTPPTPDMLVAELLLTSTHAYVSNRNDPHPEGDTIAIFPLLSAQPHAASSPLPQLRIGAEVRTGLKHLRGMAFSEDQRWLISGGVHGGGIKVFERTQDGGLKEVVRLDGVEKPTSFAWLTWGS